MKNAISGRERPVEKKGTSRRKRETWPGREKEKKVLRTPRRDEKKNNVVLVRKGISP